MDRMEILRSLFKASDFGLEIGPSYNPVAPKSLGYNVETIDYICVADLKHKYQDDSNIDISKIEEVDYVTDGQRITSLINNKHYDYIIASHVIEHIPDFIGFLKDCQSILNEDGILILAIPDKRFCFDIFQSLTSTGDLIQAYLEQRTRHPVGKIFDHFAYSAYSDGRLAWSKDELVSLKLTNSISEAKQLLDAKKESSEYIDVHGWRFTPASFRLIVNDLYQAGYINLKEKDFHDTLEFEFFLTLSRHGNGCPVDRQKLLEECYNINSFDLPKIDKKISVVIPVYNGKKYIEKAIHSVVEQTLPPDEIIVVNDGSTDDSALIIAELANKYPIKFFQKENGGQSSARNYAVRVSDGDLIAFLDQDDIWYPNHLQELVRPFLEERYPEIGWVYSSVDEIGEGDELKRIDCLSFTDSVHPKKTIDQCLASDMFVIPSATLISKKAFDDVGGFDERLSGYEDDDLFVRIFSKGYGNVFINKSLAQWRIHGNSCSWGTSMATSRIIYAKKLLQEYPDDYVRCIKYRKDIILPRFIRIIFSEINRGIFFKNKTYVRLMRDSLRELYPYMNFALKLKCHVMLFVFRHQVLKSILYPFARIFRMIAPNFWRNQAGPLLPGQSLAKS